MRSYILVSSHEGPGKCFAGGADHVQVGGPARYLVEAATNAEVAEAVQFSRAQGLPLFVLGGGSNLVVSDAGWPGVVLKIAIAGIDERTENGKVAV